MGHLGRSLSKTKEFVGRHFFFILSLGYLLLAFKLLPDYGIGFDSPKNFDEGRIHLNYLLTGHTPPQDQFVLAYQIHGSFFFMVSDLFKRILGDSLGWLDPVSARHFFLPILVFFFINLFYEFLRKRTDLHTALLTCALLLTTPRFWGYMFQNIKDIPLFVCFSISLFSFYEWHASGFRKLRYLYGTFLAVGLALLSKLYACLVPAILILWLVVLVFRPAHLADPKLQAESNPWTSRNLFHALLGFALVLILLALFFMPAFYGVKEKVIFWRIKSRVVRNLMEYGNQGWSVFPWIQVFYITPILTLVLAVVGLIKTLLQKPLSPLFALFLTWFFVVMIVACTSLFPVYNGIRLFMVFLIPFCFFAASGVTYAAELLKKISSLNKTLGLWILGMGLILTQVGGIVRTHPYEALFFNRLAGGLKGAQEKHIPDAADYWLTSYREAVRWINRNAPPNAFVWLPSSDGFFMIQHYPLRKDLKYNFVRKTPLPGNSFLIMTFGETCWINVTTQMQKNIQLETNGMTQTYEIKRQGGEILTIYYKL